MYFINSEGFEKVLFLKETSKQTFPPSLVEKINRL